VKILGIDPGLVNTGFGIISHAKKIEVLDYGIISPDIKTELSVRLNTIYNDTKLLIKKYLPDCLSIEEVFYSNNVKTTMKLGQARGAVLIAAAEFDLAVYEYSARKIKLSLTGNGNSTKEQVKFMVENRLKVSINTIKNDASDALAAALCHEQQFRYNDL
jgi:crossover junction endodeoxyribonuclease RuvC